MKGMMCKCKRTKRRKRRSERENKRRLYKLVNYQ